MNKSELVDAIAQKAGLIPAARVPKFTPGKALKDALAPAAKKAPAKKGKK